MLLSFRYLVVCTWDRCLLHCGDSDYSTESMTTGTVHQDGQWPENTVGLLEKTQETAGEGEGFEISVSLSYRCYSWRVLECVFIHTQLCVDLWIKVLFACVHFAWACFWECQREIEREWKRGSKRGREMARVSRMENMRECVCKKSAAQGQKHRFSFSPSFCSVPLFPVIDRPQLCRVTCTH